MFQQRLLLTCIALGLTIGLIACGGMSGAPPTITAQPQDVTTPPGQPATFSVTASGSMPLSYQWSMNGMAVQGATSATYTIPAPTLAQNNSQIIVTVSNATGSVNSTTATLHVIATP
jgi:Immunoglobulin domain